MSDPYAFESLEAFKTRLKQTFEPLRAEFRARSELLKLKQGKSDVYTYAQNIRLLASSIVANLVHEHTFDYCVHARARRWARQEPPVPLRVGYA